MQNSELLRDCRTLENEIQQQRNKINILQDTLSKGNGSDREFFVQKFLVQLNKVACYIEEVYNDVVKKSGEENLYANTIRSVLGSFTTMRQSIEQRKDRWSNLSLDSVYYELQTLAKDGITQDGWVNILNYLDLYAAATRELADGFRQHGVSLSKLGVLVSEVNTLMGWCGISVIKPHLLVEEFDPAYHSYVNADQWIEYFDKDINSRDYQGRVFDVSCIGYTIDKEVKKSEVFYI